MSARFPSFLSVVCLVVTWTLVAGCGGRDWYLPPPDGSAAVPVSRAQPMDAAEQARVIEARRTVLALQSAIVAQQWADAYALLSNETRMLLDSVSDGRGEEALATGRIRCGDTWCQVDPLQLFLLPDVQQIVDHVDGEEEHETARRRELFLIDRTGNHRKVVVIREGDQWLVHLPSWPRTLLQPAEASPGASQTISRPRTNAPERGALPTSSWFSGPASGA